VSQLVDDSALARARDAVDRESWDEAYVLLRQANQERALEDEDLIRLADAAYLSGHYGMVRKAWERIHRVRLQKDDILGAAEAATQLSFAYFEASLHAPAQAWLDRTARLLEGMEESAVHGALATVRSYIAVSTGRIEEALPWARRAVEIATRHDDITTLTLARVAEARALIYGGHPREGLALIDEVMVRAAAGDLAPVHTALVYCLAICVWQGVSDYEKAEEWTDALRLWCDQHDVGGQYGRCRVHRAEILLMRGSCREAEEQAQLGAEEMRGYSKVEAGWPLYELGLIRMRLGNLPGAEEAFLEAHELGWEPQPGLALLRLAQGDVEGAAASIRSSLERPSDTPSIELPPSTELRRAPLLAAQVDIAVAANDLVTARWAAEDLGSIASSVDTKALKATAAAARGTVQLAGGDGEDARASFTEVVHLWKELDAPYETARARTALASAHRAAGDEGAALLELQAARSTFQRLGATLDAQSADRAIGQARVARSSAGAREDKVFMFTDIVKSTDLANVIGDEAWGHLVRWHNETLSRLISEHRGELVRTTGDGFFVAFDEAHQAVGCAVAIQLALADHRRDQGFSPTVRIGLHRSGATREGTDWSGFGVHAAARIGGLAEGDEILASLETAEAAGDDLALSEPRTVSLKGIPEPVDVVAISWH
jgi:class 3 adenylate cyclase/predicted metal-dependent hydrolase